MQRIVWFGLGAVVMALLTWMVAWWTVPIVAAALALVRRDDAFTPLIAGAAAILAWGGLLLVSAFGAPVGEITRVVGTAMGIGPAALIALTLAFAALLASSAGALARAVLGGR